MSFLFPLCIRFPSIPIVRGPSPVNTYYNSPQLLKMPIISKRVAIDIKKAYSGLPFSTRLTHRILTKATFIAIHTIARLSPITNRLPSSIRDTIHDIPVSLLRQSAFTVADCAGGRNMPSLEALRNIALEVKTARRFELSDGLNCQCSVCADRICEAHDPVSYHWYMLAENAAVLQFSLLYFDAVNSTWEAFQERWGEVFIAEDVEGNRVSPLGSFTHALSTTAKNGVIVAACASERFLHNYRWLFERDPERRGLLEGIKRRYGAPRIVAAWARELPGGLVERACGIDS